VKLAGKLKIEPAHRWLNNQEPEPAKLAVNDLLPPLNQTISALPGSLEDVSTGRLGPMFHPEV